MADNFRNANRQRIEHIEACFGSQGRPLNQDGRILVGEGVLIKMCRKKPKPRQIFLFNDLLVYGSILISKKRYHKQRVIPLQQVQLENLEDEADKHGWVVRARGKSFAVYAATAKEKAEWMLHIERCVQELIKNGARPDSVHAAVWIPDSEATVCMCCHETQFTLLHRRHHCRSCGHVVCGACSLKRFVIPGVDKRPVRVCNRCYQKLSIGDNSVIRTRTEQASESDDSDDDEEVPEVPASPQNPTTFYGGREGPSTSAVTM
uniref:Pleckstrin homology domain-containing family F member 2 n=1 Tax=Panagrellus redivivus TaxID=6233 RepID=A0A7E4UV34_PANRE